MQQTVKKIAVAQTGGCSPVINSTLAGAIERAQEAGIGVLGLVNAFEGLLADRVAELGALTADDLARLRATPAAFLGSSRLHLTDEIFAAIPRRLAARGVEALVLIGGNGTMYAAAEIGRRAAAQGVSLRVVGAPKTVDNDLVGVEFAPGYGSAARYVAEAVRDLGIDLEAMKTFEQVRIVEVMGRSVGWLAAAAGLANRGPGTAPHLIYLPEQPFDEAEFLQEIERAYRTHGYVVAVVGEGVADADGHPVGSNPFADLSKGSRIYGGAAAHLAALVHDKLQLRARAQDLTIAQRCFTPLRSPRDEAEAYLVGRYASEALLGGAEGKMASIDRRTGGCRLLELAAVGGKEQRVPEEFYDARAKQVTPAFLEWIRPMAEPWECKYLSLHEIQARGASPAAYNK